MTLEASTHSRLKSTPTVILNGEEVWGTWDKPVFLRQEVPESQQLSIRVNSDRACRPDLIANDIYGTTRLDWVLIAFNDALEALNWPRTGTVIKAPIPDIVYGEVL